MKKYSLLCGILILGVSMQQSVAQELVNQNQTNIGLNRQFIEAYHAQSRGEIQRAIQQYEALIKTNPKQPEPYLNLSAIYAKQGNLEKARAILLEGLATDSLYARLFFSLQKVHGQMAANVYREALNEKIENTELDLPLLPSLRKIKPFVTE